MFLLIALACAPDTDDKAPAPGAGDDTAVDTADTGAPDDTADPGPSCAEEPPPPETKDTGDGPRPAQTLTGSITWTLAFDEAAEAAGYVDCTYTRVYEQVEVSHQGYLCPDCRLVGAGSTLMTEGYEDCFLQISDADIDRPEHLGLGEVEGALHLFRAGNLNVSLADMGAVVGEDGTYAVAWEDEGELDSGGTMLLSAAGELVEGTAADVLLDDVTGARTEPYTCGWPLNSPGGPNPSWEVTDGELFPNVRLADQCGEPVDLWDFRGHYLVIDSSAPNCGPCQVMAEGAEAFKARMEAACAPIEMITLLNESLSAINKPASLETQQAWVEEFGLTSPVLADEGAAYALFPDYLGIESGMSYPAVIVVDPDGNVLYGSTGFGDWAEFEDVILADWEARGGGSD